MKYRLQLRCPVCRGHIPRWPWSLTDRGESHVVCARCRSQLRVRRRWKYQFFAAVVLLPIMLLIAPAMQTFFSGALPIFGGLPPAWRDVPIGAAISFAIIITAFLAMPYRVTVIQTGTGCHSCGYDLRGIEHGRCPECGSHSSVET